MELRTLLRKINQHTWWEEKSPAVYQYVMYPLHCFVEQCRYFHPKYLTLSVFVSTPGDFFHELTPEDEKLKIYWYIYDQLKKDPRYLARRRQASERAKAFLGIAKSFERKCQALTNLQVWQSYQEFLRHYSDYVRYVVALECVDPFTQYQLGSLVRAELPGVPAETVREITRTMAIPAHLSFMEVEHEVVLEYAVALYRMVHSTKKMKFSELDQHWKKRFATLAAHYYWLRNSYATVLRLAPQDFFNQVRDEACKKSRRVLRQELRSLRSKVRRIGRSHRTLSRRYGFSPGLQRHFRLVQYFGEWIDNRKEHMLQGNDCLERYCREIARRFAVPIHDVRYYLPNEFKALLLHRRRLDRRTIRARQTFSAYVIEKRGSTAVPTIFYGRQARQRLSAVQSRFQVTKGQVAGQVASAPNQKFSGVVQVIKDVHKEKFKAGRILVASMTRPDFVPLMRRARAIITDEGGLTCHAAIVSRELRLPCIIGTKNATAEFKTGDRVTMDLQTGSINKH